MQSTPNLGELITDESAERDAIHIAVAPVIAGDYLNPGQQVTLDWNGYAVATSSDAIGVVDPYLPGSVKRGQRFWLMLYPNTITSLRHEWKHPRFFPKPTKEVVMSVSEAWLREFAEDYYTDYQSMMESVAEALRDGDDCLGCLGSSSDVNYEKFWYHYKELTGSSPDTEDKWFRCAC
jgi:hypothetical protein